MKDKPTYSLKRHAGIYAAQAALLLAAPASVFAQAQPCLGSALGISTNCSGSIGGSATLAPLTPFTRSTVGSAGNPVSVSSFAVDSFFNNAAEVTLSTGKTTVSPKESASARSASIEASGALSYYDVDGTAVRRVSLPLAYTIQSDIDTHNKLTFRLPITRTTWGANQSSTSIGLGLDYRMPITDDGAWSITPALSYTHSDGDEFSGGKAGIWALGATSIYRIQLGENDSGDSLAIANMLGYSSVRNNTDSSTTNNVILRNGVMYTRPVELFDEPLGMQAFLTHTHYTSKDVLIQNYVELGLNFGTAKSAFSTKDYWRAGLSFTKSDNTKGVSLTVGYWF
jgi:hypothetical protein